VTHPPKTRFVLSALLCTSAFFSLSSSVGCGSDKAALADASTIGLSDAAAGDTSTNDGGSVDTTTPDGATADAGNDAVAAPGFIPFPTGSPASTIWDDKTQTLLIADNQGNQIWKWTDNDGLSKVATTPDPGGELDAGATLVGQIVALADGTLVVSRFGKPGGGFAAIAWVKPDGTSGLVPNVDETLKHLGLTQTADGTLYGSYFGKAPSGMGQAGAVTRVNLATGETVVATGFGKIVGVLAVAETLYVSDQTAGAVLSAPLAALPPEAKDWTVFAHLPVPDLLCAGPDGSLFSGQFQAAAGSTDPVAVRRILKDGTVTTFAHDPDVAKPSGVAYDPTHRRLFAADTGNVANIGIHVFPVN
jgi:sugar lactone lactonase YvrE